MAKATPTRPQPQDRRQKQPTKKAATSAKAWKDSTGHDVEVPSGNVCRAKRPGIQVFMEQGIIPNSLLKYVKDAIGNEEEKVEIKFADLEGDQLQEMLALFDAVTCHIVLEPHVEPVMRYEDGRAVPISERDDDVLYVDEVELEDKMFLFQWAVGGVEDVAKFREEQTDAMARVRAGADVGSASK